MSITLDRLLARSPGSCMKQSCSAKKETCASLQRLAQTPVGSSRPHMCLHCKSSSPLCGKHLVHAAVMRELRQRGKVSELTAIIPLQRTLQTSPLGRHSYVTVLAAKEGHKPSDPTTSSNKGTGAGNKWDPCDHHLSILRDRSETRIWTYDKSCRGQDTVSMRTVETHAWVLALLHRSTAGRCLAARPVS